MHLHHTLEDTAANNAWTEYRPADKALLCGCLLSLALVLPPWPWALCLILVSFAFACLWAEVPCLFWARALTPALAFGLLGVLPLIWMDGSLERAIRVTLRSSAAGSALVLLIVTSPAGELLGAAQRIRTLRPLVEITFLTLRFATILRECAASASIAWHLSRWRAAVEQIRIFAPGCGFSLHAQSRARSEDGYRARATYEHGRPELLGSRSPRFVEIAPYCRRRCGLPGQRRLPAAGAFPWR
jgi:Cobalt transport protein